MLSHIPSPLDIRRCLFCLRKSTRRYKCPLDTTINHRPSEALYDHLRNALSAESLAALERLALYAGQCVEEGSDQQKDGRSNQAAHICHDAYPLYDTHHSIDGSAHVVGAESTDEGVEFGRGWADSEEEGYLDEYDDECAYSVRDISCHSAGGQWVEGNVHQDNRERDLAYVCGENVGDSER